MIIEENALKKKKGEWLKIYPDNEEWNVYECSHCGEEFDLIEGTPYDNEYNFCPNCGADMRGNAKSFYDRMTEELGENWDMPADMRGE